jgi:hypothetical protein
MQPKVEPARAGLTEAQIISLLQDSPALQLSAGMELMDLGLNVLDDISDDLAGGSVSRNSYADLHATAQFRITRVLDWGAALVRPYIIVANSTISARFNLGTYHTNTPAYSMAESPPTFDVSGYDILFRLAQPVGDSYSINAGDSYLAVVEGILLQVGYTQYIIDQSSAAVVAPSARSWIFSDDNTWLTVVNDLLASIGYAGIWSDWDGRLRCEPYILPQNRLVEWVYTDDAFTTMMSPNREVQFDFFEAPNRWVTYRTNGTDDVAPVEGAGIYTYINQSVGITSVDARGGLTVSRVTGVDAADQASLVAQAQQMIQADMDIPTLMTVETSPNPLHWHFDRLYVSSNGVAGVADMQCTEWTLQLPPDISDMAQTWRTISQ